MRNPGKTSICRVVAAGSIVVTVAVIAPPMDDAGAYVSFSRNGARHFARSYAYGHPGHPYEPFDSDCTNFVSYVWHLGGGTGQNGSWFMDDAWWRVDQGQREWSGSWTVTQDFFNYHTNHHYENGGIYARGITGNKTAQSPGAGTEYGDAIIYNFNDGGSSWDHAAIDTNIIYFGTYYDSKDNVNYILNMGMTSISQHTYDRRDAPWNFPYLFEKYYQRDDVQADGMIFKTVHVNT